MLTLHLGDCLSNFGCQVEKVLKALYLAISHQHHLELLGRRLFVSSTSQQPYLVDLEET